MAEHAEPSSGTPVGLIFLPDWVTKWSKRLAWICFAIFLVLAIELPNIVHAWQWTFGHHDQGAQTQTSTVSAQAQTAQAASSAPTSNESQTKCLDLYAGEHQGCDFGTDGSPKFYMSVPANTQVCWGGDFSSNYVVAKYWVANDPNPHVWTGSDADRNVDKIAWQLFTKNGSAHVTYFVCS